MGRDSFLIDYHDYLLVTFPSLKFSSPPESSLQHTLENLKNVFRRERVDIAAPCTGDGTEGCWILSHLSPCNLVLFPIRIQLVASTPTQLTLCSLPGRYFEPFEETDLFEACILVHWLLKWHRCIHKVHLNSYYYTSSQFVYLFHDSLSHCKSLRQLVISCVSGGYFGGDILATALGRMESLEELELREVSLDGRALNDVGHRLGARNTLTKLTFFGNAERPQPSCAFLDGVKFSTNLKAIKLCVMYIGSDSVQYLEEILGRNEALEKVAFWNVSFTCKAFCVVAASLGLLKQLKKLEFVSCVLQRSGITLLAEAIKQQREMKSLRVEACKLGDSDADSALILAPLADAVLNSNLQELNFSNISIDNEGVQALAKYLGSSQSLRKLFLKDNALTAQGAISLLEGISRNASEATYHLGHIATDDAEAESVRRAIQRSRTGDRVQLTYSSAGYFQLARAVKTNFCKITKLLLEDNLYLTARHLEELFDAIGHNAHVTQLVVKSGQFNVEVASALGRSLTASAALKSLELGVEVHPLCQTILFKSLTRNTSLTKLSIKRCRFDEPSTVAFVDMLQKNRTLNNFSKFSGSFRHVERLSSEISLNYTLLKLTFDLECVKTRATFIVEETLRRNQMLLNCAVKFALRLSCKRQSAVSFERVFTSDAFLQHLVAVGKISKCQAHNCIKCTLRYVAENYLVLTTVVKGRLECFANSKQSIQFDQLHQDCLAHIFSYLKVSDVVCLDDYSG